MECPQYRFSEDPFVIIFMKILVINVTHFENKASSLRANNARGYVGIQVVYTEQ